MSIRENVFKKSNIKIFAFEFHGHGKSGGTRCSFNSFDDIVDDLLYVVIHVKKNYPNIPIFILAESIGATVAIKYNIKYDNMYKINGYILSAPMCGLDSNLIPPTIVTNLAIKISYIYPTVPLIHNNAIKYVNNKEYMYMRKKNKYFYHHKLRLNVLRECYYAIEWIKTHGNLFMSPLFLIHGLTDIITDPQMSIQFWINTQTKIKHIYLPKNIDHNVFIGNNNNDKHPQIVWDKIIDWINICL